MKMTAQRRALDKIYKRRDRYDIPDWQRRKVWNTKKKQDLIDSILRGWRLPKFYLVKVAEDQFEVVDGQQRLTAILEFMGNDLPLPTEAAKTYGGIYYKDLSSRYSDAFDDFEIDYDEIEEASQEELKSFFQRLQQGLPLTASERLNSEHSRLRDFCKDMARHAFFAKSVKLPDTRYAHFDVMCKVLVVEIEGINSGLRYADIKRVFADQAGFSSTSAVAKRIELTLKLLAEAFPNSDGCFKNRTIIQSVISLACRLVNTGGTISPNELADFVRKFTHELSRQVELGQAATDTDFLRFQRTINANVKGTAKTRQEILLRKLFLFSPKLATMFSSDAIHELGLSTRTRELGNSVGDRIGEINNVYSSKHGEDLFKSTNKTVKAMRRLERPISSLEDYKDLIDNLYFLFRESIGQRLADNLPESFKDVNLLRTDLQHDVDHGSASDVRAKRRKISAAFAKYSGESSPDLLDPDRFVLVHVNLLSALETDLAKLHSQLS